MRGLRLAVLLVGAAALAAVHRSRVVGAGCAHWPLRDVRVYWWGGQPPPPPGRCTPARAQFSFTYPPFAAAAVPARGHRIPGGLAGRPSSTVVSVAALVALVGMSLAAAGVRPRPETVLAITALSAVAVAGGVHAAPGRDQSGHSRAGGLGPAPAARWRLVAGDRYRGRGRDQADPADLRGLPGAHPPGSGSDRPRPAAFAATVATGFGWLPGASRVFWLDGVFAARTGSGTQPTRRTSRWPGR